MGAYMKICIRCNEEKDLSNFHKKGSYYYGECKICMNSRNAARMMKNKMKIIKYKGGECKLCGYSKNPKALEFHHRDPAKKDFSISSFKNSNIKKLKKEADKCDLLCSNCHKEVHDAIWKSGNTINWKVYNNVLNGSMKDLRAKGKKYFCSCGEEVSGAKRKCIKCAHLSQEKINWPSDLELEKLVWKKPKAVLAKELGVSDKAIAKRCLNRNITQPPKGYWIKKS